MIAKTHWFDDLIDRFVCMRVSMWMMMMIFIYIYLQWANLECTESFILSIELRVCLNIKKRYWMMITFLTIYYLIFFFTLSSLNIVYFLINYFIWFLFTFFVVIYRYHLLVERQYQKYIYLNLKKCEAQSHESTNQRVC